MGGTGIAKLVWGITGEKPFGNTTAPASAPLPNKVPTEIPTPSDVLFLDEVFELLDSYPTLILIAQDDREPRAALDSLRERAQERYGADQVLHLVPPRNPGASEAEFFETLGSRTGMDPPAASAMDFERFLDGRLVGGCAQPGLPFAR
jgi:hypothetical protein